MSKPKIILDAGVTQEELLLLVSPTRSDDGKIKHDAEFEFNEKRIKHLISEREDFSPEVKNRLYFILNKMINTINTSGMHKYIPDKFKGVIPLLFGMAMMSDDNFINLLENKK